MNPINPEAEGTFRDLKFVYIPDVHVFDPAMVSAVGNYPDGQTNLILADGSRYKVFQMTPQRVLEFLAPHIGPVVTLASADTSLVTFAVRDAIEGYRPREGQEIELRFSHSVAMFAPVSAGAFEAIMEEACGSMTRIVIRPEEKPKPIAAARSTYLRVRILREWGHSNGLLQERDVRTLPPEEVATMIANGIAILAPEGGDVEMSIAEYGFAEARKRGFRISSESTSA